MDAPTTALITALVVFDVFAVTGAVRAVIRKVRA
jgi:hypothetical protein